MILRAIWHTTKRTLGTKTGIVGLSLVSGSVVLLCSDMTPVCKFQSNELRGKTYIVTGGTSGIGFQISLVLAKAGARVIIPTRDETAAAEKRRYITLESGSQRVFVRPCDLNSGESIRNFVENVVRNVEHVDGLINCAGVMYLPRRKADINNNELTMSTNFLGPFLLTNLLLPKMLNQDRDEADPHTRPFVLNIDCHNSSSAASISEIDLMLDNNSYDKRKAYEQSKASLLAFTMELADRTEDQRLEVLSASPKGGVKSTNLYEYFQKSVFFGLGWATKLYRFLAFNTAKGAAYSSMAAVFMDKVDHSWYAGLPFFGSGEVEVRTTTLKRSGRRVIDRDEQEYPLSIGERKDRIALWEYASSATRLDDEFNKLEKQLAVPKPKAKTKAIMVKTGDDTYQTKSDGPEFAYDLKGVLIKKIEPNYSGGITDQTSYWSYLSYLNYLNPLSYWS